MVIILRKRLFNLVCFTLILIVLSSSYTLATSYPSKVRYINGKWVMDNGYVVTPSMIPYPGFGSEFRTQDFLLMPYNEYLEYRNMGIIDLDADIIIAKHVNTGEKWVFALIEPEIIKKSIPIYGELFPGDGDVYGPYGSCVAIYVDVSWGPSDQTLGIVLLEVDTGHSYGYWFSGGHAEVSFSVDWTKSYYILILSKNTNTQVIFYTGTITLYIW